MLLKRFLVISPTYNFFYGENADCNRVVTNRHAEKKPVNTGTICLMLEFDMTIVADIS